MKIIKTMQSVLPITGMLTVLLLSRVGAQSAPPSLYSDRKAHRVGDMVTILVTENAKAKRQSETSSQDENLVAAQGAIDGNLLQFLPVFGLQSDLKTKSGLKEATTQQDQITGRIAAVIEEVTPNGLFAISGTKLININGERNLMTVKGEIRPRDISSSNTVFSYNIANSKIFYSRPGIPGKFVKRGSFTRMANVIMGGAGLMIIGYVGGLSALAIIRSFAL